MIFRAAASLALALASAAYDSLRSRNVVSYRAWRSAHDDNNRATWRSVIRSRVWISRRKVAALVDTEACYGTLPAKCAGWLRNPPAGG